MGEARISDVLSKAADLLEPKGAWMQGDFCNGLDLAKATCFCIEGAVAKVMGLHGMDAENWCDEHLSPLVFDGENAARYNDEEGRTQAEVVAKLREAAALAEQGA